MGKRQSIRLASRPSPKLRILTVDHGVQKLALQTLLQIISLKLVMSIRAVILPLCLLADFVYVDQLISKFGSFFFWLKFYGTL